MALGLENMFPISAEHGRGIDDLLDAILDVLQIPDRRAGRQQTSSEDPESADGSRRANGDRSDMRDEQTPDSDARTERQHARSKSRHHRPSQCRQVHAAESLTGMDRSIVSPIPGTTRDAVDEVIERDGRKFRFIDTAGIRRKGKTHLMAEKLSVVMARKHLEAADIALLVIDATEGVSQLDAAIAGYAHESGRSIIIVINKWDLVMSGEKKAVSQSKAARIRESKRPADRVAYEERLRHGLKFLSYAPLVFISAATGKGTEKIFPLSKRSPRNAAREFPPPR